MSRNILKKCANALACLLALASGAALALAQGGNAPWGEERVAEQSVTVRHRPDPAAPVVRTLKAGDHVRVDFIQANGWAALFDTTENQREVTRAIGYAELRQLTPAAQYKPTAAAAKPESKPAAPSEHKAEVKEQPSLLSGAAPGQGQGKQSPVRITSDKMVYNQAENAVVFLGNVHGTQDDMAIWATKATAYIAQKPKEQKGQKQGDKPADKAGDFGDKIDRIVAEGNVRLVVGKNEGACGMLTFYVNDGVLRMDQNPILREGQNTVRGDVIKFYINENRSEVLSGTQRRVEAIFYNSPKQEGK